MATRRNTGQRGNSPSSAVGLASELLMAGIEIGQVLGRALREQVGLNVSQFNVLRALAGRDGGTAHAVDLVRVLGMSSAHATTVIQQLDERGLVERRESSVDRRRRAVTVTDDGHHALAEALPLLADLEAQLVGAIGGVEGSEREQLRLRQMRLAMRHGLTAQEWDDCIGP